MSDRVEIIRMAQARNQPAQIAVALNCKPQKVYDVLKKARKAGADIPPFPTGRKIVPMTLVQIPQVTAQKLAPMAEVRAMNVPQLIAAITSSVATQQLVDAILGAPIKKGNLDG